MRPVDSSSSETPRSPTTNGVQQPNLSLGAVGIEVQADDASFDVGGHAFSYNNNALAVTNNFFGQSSANNAQVRDFAARSLRAASASHDLAYSNALAQRTPDTGQWFLELQEFARWKSGDLQLLECIGTPGAGKTVMSSITIEHLRKSRSEAFVLYLYHQTRVPHSQTLHTCALALLCQALEKGSELILPTELLRTFALQHGSADRLPTYELLRPDLIQALAGPDTYIVVDALDEYNIGDVVAQTEFIRELETLNVKILVTSRSHVPFKQKLGNFASCKISALPDNIRAFVNYSMEKSYLGDVLRRGDGTLDEVREAAVNKADGIFLSTKLLLTAMRGCHIISEVKSRLQESSSNLNGTYEQILIHIRATSPWILPLIYFMVIFVDRTIGARAMLQYLACDSWPGGSERIEDYIRGADDVLASCRGLVVLVDQQNEEDRGAQHATPAIPDVGKGFQFCHSTALDYLQAHIVQDALSEARLALVHRFLSYAPKLLAGVPKEMGGARPDEDSYSAGRLYLRRWYPLSFHQDLWQHCAKQVEESVDRAAVDPYFSHPTSLTLP
ncbi:hypothetical protein BDV98DRAFT_597930 [Pterulicium gracile]|uniref:Nephrocystin 3-like N-terminal domain-containing protein n=1 Tax=Pterulicium gracile TaxID=1884261 RepID=A0A5C3QCH7_9AGAR|nr:hypothetical protein BDV98DRAFT_597930 [Pterula gracilis]